MATNREIEARREKVARLTLQGFSAAQIAKAMKVTSRTIEKDREKHRKNWAKKFKEGPFEAALYSFMMQHDAAFKEAWKLLENTSNDNVKLGCINSINKCAETKIRILQSLGIVDQAPEKLELSGRLSVQKILEIGERVLEKKKREEADKQKPEG